MIARISRDPQLRRLELGFLGFAIAEHGTWLASMLYAYHRGGVTETGLAAVVLLAPALLVAPIGAFAADRFDSGRVLTAGYALQACSMIAAAVAVAGDLPAVVVYATLMLIASAITLTRPAVSSVLPTATHTPADLTAANVVIGFIEYSGMLLGPMLAGLLIGRFGVATPFFVFGGLVVGAAFLASRIRAESGVMPDGEAMETTGMLADTLDGLRALHGHRPVRIMIGMLSLGALVNGAADVLFVATADRLGGGDASRAGLLGAAFGLGAIMGSALTVLLVGRARLTPSVAMGVGAMGLSLAVLSDVGGVGLAAVCFAVMGGGESVLRVSVATLMQRLAPSDVVGRFFGIVEGLRMFAIAIGAALIGLLVARFGYETGVLVAGTAIPVLLLVRTAALFRIDRDAVPPDERVLELILGDDIFSALPAPTIERLAADAERYRVPAGGVIVVEGTSGDRYFVIDIGEVEVARRGRLVNSFGPGGGFGELALLSDSPRIATVTARTDVDLLGFGREQFLQAVTGHQRTAAVGRERSERYLGAES